MSKVMIREAVMEDVPALEALFKASYGELLKTDYPGPLLERALPMLSKVNLGLIERGQFFVALSMDGDLAGAGGWSYEPPGHGETVPGRAHIRHVAVSPKHTGRGVGRHIIDHCRDHAGDIHILECFATLSAVRFYEKLGFEVLREFDVALGGEIPFSSVHMLKDFRAN
ncbi:GNAT family N-acetyltransferase [Aestuariispira ectoiniformans]|uniref:GNAT family N-acetyltransferase n=1 Tax=Aestuariispira ectoiniformans TaxID=2775080 RepID=UPI00223C1F0A|nr:GNAT family N-acetyltransferase [Aestuariispira ectoiniformans]